MAVGHVDIDFEDTNYKTTSRLANRMNPMSILYQYLNVFQRKGIFLLLCQKQMHILITKMEMGAFH